MKKSLFYLLILVSAFVSFSCSYMIDDMKNLSKGGSSSETTAYVVENFFEAVKTSDYDPALTQISEPKQGSVEEVEAGKFSGFSFEKKTIEDNNSYPDTSVKKIIKFYYKRNSVTLSFDLDGGYISSSSSVYKISGKYGEKITAALETPSKNGFEFMGWYKVSDSEKTLVAVPAEFPEENLELKAVWKTASTSARYSVKFEYEKLDGTYEILYIKEKSGVPSAKVEIIQSEIDGQNKEGFTYSASDSTDISELTISSDNSTVIEIKYKRNSYTLTINPNGGIWVSDSSSEAKTQTVKYGMSFANVVIEEVKYSDSNVGFVKWYQEGNEASYVPDSMPAKNLTLVAQWARPFASYKVESYFESLQEEGVYAVDTNMTITMNAKVGGMSEAQPYSAEILKTFNRSGYSYKKTEQTTVLEDGSSVAKIYYDRSVVTVKYETAGGFWDGETGSDSNAKTFTGKYGTKITKLAEQPAKSLFEFNGWYLNGTKITVLPEVIPVENATYTADWKKKAALYSVSFWFEKVDSTDSTDYENNYENDLSRTFTDGTKSETKTLSAAYGSTTSAYTVIQNVAGFTELNVEEKTIADGSKDFGTEIKVYYKRNLVTYTFNPNDTVSLNTTVAKKYEAAVQTGDIPVPVRVDYKLTGWKVSGSSDLITDIPAAYPKFLADTVFTAQWEFKGTDYSIKYVFEDTNGVVDPSTGSVTSAGDYKESQEIVVEKRLTVSGNGQSGTTTNVTAPEITGFEVPEITQITIGSGDSVTVKYSRKVTAFRFDANGGKWSDSTDVKTVYGKYGASADLSGITSPSKSFAVFAGWYVSTEENSAVVTELPSTFPDSNVIYKAKWTDLDTATVNGSGEHADQEITLAASGSGSARIFTATVPYEDASKWTFVWVLDNKVQSGTFENSGKTQTFTPASLSSGNHTVQVYSYLTGTTAPVLNASVSVTVE